MNTAIYYFYHEIIGGEVYVDASGKFVNWIHENDGAWNGNYDFIVQSFGGNVIELDGTDLIPEDIEDEFNEDGIGLDDAVQSWVENNKKMILEAIRVKNASIDAPIEEAIEEDFAQTEMINHVGPVTDTMEDRIKKEKQENRKMKNKSSKKNASSKSVTKVSSQKKATSVKRSASAKKTSSSKPAPSKPISTKKVTSTAKSKKATAASKSPKTSTKKLAKSNNKKKK